MKLNSRFNGRYVQGSDGIKLFVEEIGDPARPAIFWLHGYCQAGLCWDRQFEDDILAAQYHMVRVDLRGHGLSDRLTDPAAFRDGKNWADDVQAVIEFLHLKKPILAGWSYGGYIICDYIRHYGQENIGGLIFIAAVTEMGRDEANSMLGSEFLQLASGFFSEEFVAGSTALQKLVEMTPYEELDPHTFYLLLGTSAATFPASRKGMFTRQLDNRELLKSISLPTLIVQGNDDRIVLPAYADHISSHIAHASQVSYDKCGHTPFMEMAGPFNQDVVTFMQSIPH